MVQSSLTRGWPLISIDYRVIPQASALDILGDIRDAHRFVLDKLPTELEKLQYSPKINPEKLIVAGNSAGGYVTLLAAGHFKPRPICAVGIYPVTTHDHPYFRSGTVLDGNRVHLEDIQHFIEQTPVEAGVGISQAEWQFDMNMLDDMLIYAENKREPTTGLTRGDLWDYYLTENMWPSIIGDSPELDTQKLWNDEDFPPIILLSGDPDTVVPIELSEYLVKDLADEQDEEHENGGEEEGGEHEEKVRLIKVPGVDHMFDMDIRMGEGEYWPYLEKMWRYIDNEVRWAI
jgi:acetyl esterase/lipase